MPTGDPITDLQAGNSDAQLKSKYKLSDDDLFTLKKYNYATREKGLSVDDALELYPAVKNYVKPVKQESAPASKGSVLDKFDNSKFEAKSVTDHPVSQPKQSIAIDQQRSQNAATEQIGSQILHSNKVKQGQDMMAKQTGVPAAVSSSVPLSQTELDAQNQPKPEDDSQAKVNQAVTDALYTTPAGKAFYNVVQPAVSALAHFSGNLLGSVKRLEGSLPGNDRQHFDNMADDLVDMFDVSKAAKSDGRAPFLFAQPTQLQGNLINDGKMNKSLIVPKTVENLANLGALMFGGEALAPGKIGMLANAYLSSEEDYRKEGSAAGLKGGQLDAFANTSAGLTSLLMLGLPTEQVAGKLKDKLVGEAAKDIADGVTVKQAIKRAVVDVGKANLHTTGTMLGVKAVDHAMHSALNEYTGKEVFEDDLSMKKLRDEAMETTLMSVLPTTLLMAPTALNKYTPTAQVKSALTTAASDLPGFSDAVDKSVAEGKYTPEQAQAMKDNVGKFATKLTQQLQLGYSPDQATRMAWNVYKDDKVSQHTRIINDSPILKATLGEEVKKDQEATKNDIKDAALGIPELGSEISGNDLAPIIKNTPSSTDAHINAVKDNTYRVQELDLKQKYKDDPAFRLAVENYEKPKADEEGLRTPPIVDREGNVIDGNKRLVQQYVNGEETTRVFQELKPERAAVVKPEEAPAVETKEGVSVIMPKPKFLTPEEPKLFEETAPAVNEALAKGELPVTPEELSTHVDEAIKEVTDGTETKGLETPAEKPSSGVGEDQLAGPAEAGTDLASPVQPDSTGHNAQAETAVDYEAKLHPDVATRVASKLRDWAKAVEGDTTALKSDILALPKAVISTALRGAATIIEAGGTVASAIKHAVEVFKAHHEENKLEFDAKAAKEQVKDLFRSAGIIPAEESESIRTRIKDATSKVSKDKIVEKELNALKRQIKEKFKNQAIGKKEGLGEGKVEGFLKGLARGFGKGMKEGSDITKAAQKDFDEHVSGLKQKIDDMLTDAEKRGVFTGETKGKMVEAIGRVMARAKSPLQLLKAVERVGKILDNVEYDKDLGKALVTKAKIANTIKGGSMERSASNVEVVKAFLKLKPNEVEDIKAYNDISDKILDTQKAATVKIKEGKGEVQNASHEIANAEIKKYTEEQLTHAEEQAKKRTAENYQDLVDLGVIDPKQMSLKDMQEIIKAVEDPEADKSDEVLAKAKEKKRAMSDMLQYQQMSLEQYHADNLSSGTFTPQELGIMKKIIDINPDELDMKQMVRLNDVINNIVVNGEMFGAGNAEAIHDSIEGIKIAKEKIKASGIDLKKFRDTIADNLAATTSSKHFMFEFITKSSKLAADIQLHTGIFDVFSGHARATVAQHRALEQYEKLQKSLGKDVNSADNRYRRGMYARAIQVLEGVTDPAERQAEFDRIKQMTKDSADRLLSSDREEEVQEGKVVQKVYDEILADAKNVDDVKAKMSPANLKQVEFWMDKFAEHADAVQKSAELYDNKILDMFENYTPTRVKPIKGEKINSDEELDMFKQGFLSKKLDMSPAKTKMNRSTKLKLEKNTVFDFNFDDVQARRYYDTMYDLETAPAIAKVRAFFDSDAAESVLGGSRNKEIMQESIKNAVLAQKNKLIPPQRIERMAVSFLNTVQAKGARIALGSLSQLPKQYVSVAASTMINLGGDMGLYFKAFRVPNDIPLFDQSSIAMRGSTKAGYNHSTDIASVDRTKFGNDFQGVADGIKELQHRVSEAAMKPLVFSDVSVARTSWLSYYMQDLQRRGIDINIDWKKAHENYDKEAGAYAEQMVSRSQNPNNNTELGDFQLSTKGGAKILSNIILPFSNFAMNQRTRMFSDIQKIRAGGNSAEAWKSLAATASEQVIFNAFKIYVLGAMTTGLAHGLASAFGFWNDKDEENLKKYSDVDVHLAGATIHATDKAKKLVANSISDFLFSGMGNMTQQGIQRGLNWVYRNVASETLPNAKNKKDDAPQLFYNMPPPKDRIDFSPMGMYSILPTSIQEIAHRSEEAVTGKTDKYVSGGAPGKAKTESVDITPDERKLIGINFLINSFAMFGVGDADISNMNNKLSRIIDKKMQSSDRYGGKTMEIVTPAKKHSGAKSSGGGLPNISK